MAKSNKIFKETDKLKIEQYKVFNNIEPEIRALLLLSLGWDLEIYSYERVKGRLRSLRNGTLLNLKGTYKSPVNGKFYNLEQGSEILEDELNLNSFTSIEVKFTTLLKVISLYTGYSYNECLDIILVKIIRFIVKWCMICEMSPDGMFYISMENSPRFYLHYREDECSCCGRSQSSVCPELTISIFNESAGSFFHQYKRGNLKRVYSTVKKLNHPKSW